MTALRSAGMLLTMNEPGRPERIVVTPETLEKIAVRLAEPGKPGARLRSAASRAAQESGSRSGQAASPRAVSACTDISPKL